MGKVIVIGGGASGMMAAVAAAQAGHEVHIFEKNDKLGKKLYISGKGRCNLTNDCDRDGLLAAVLRNPRFLHSAFSRFDNHQAMAFFEACGVKLKTERGGRVFPESDHSSDIIKALRNELARLNVLIHLNSPVQNLVIEEERYVDKPASASNSQVDGAELIGDRPAECDVTGSDVAAAGTAAGVLTASKPVGDDTAGNGGAGSGEAAGGVAATGAAPDTSNSLIAGVELADGRVVACDACIVATGGVSYPLTGSTGDGHRLARQAGHQVTELLPGLVPIETAEQFAKDLQGLSLKNIAIRITDGATTLYEDFGEMLFTHYGVSGPVILSAASVVGERLAQGPLRLSIDLKPALSLEQLDQRILREFESARNRQFKNAVAPLFPARLRPVMLQACGIDPDKRVSEVTRQERQSFAALTKNLPLTLTALRGFDEAIITRGGVDVSQIDPSTMQSKLVKGLHFAGEVLDVDALTGGFNLQIAWSTGYQAGSNVL